MGPAAFVFIAAFALPVVVVSVRTWVWLYTLGLPRDMQERRRREMDSELSEHIHEDRTAGYRPVEIALRVWTRCIYGVLDDICWSAAEHWVLFVTAWTFLVVWMWARFVLPRQMRTMAPNDRLGLLFGVILLLLVLWVVNTREQAETA